MKTIYLRLLRVLPFIIFSSWTLAYFYFYGHKAGDQIADLEWYYKSFCKFTPEFFNFVIRDSCSGLIFDSSTTNSLYELWKAPPIYTYIFLAPNFIIRSNLLLVLEGYLLGIFIFICLRKAALKYNICKPENAFLIDISLCFFSFNIYFIKDVLSMSNNSVLLFWMGLCLCSNSKNTLFKVIIWSLSFFIRPASIFVISAFYLSIVIKKNKNLYKFIKYIPVFIFIYLIAYFSYIRSWPVPIINQALMPYIQGLPTEIRDEKTLALLSKALNREINFQSELFFSDIFNIFYSKLPFTLFINFFQKLQASIGDGYLLNYFTDTKLHTAFFIGNLYNWLLQKPSFYLCIFYALFNKKLKGCIASTVIIYLSLTSIFAGDPRYSIIFSPIMVFILIELMYIESKKLNLKI